MRAWSRSGRLALAACACLAQACAPTPETPPIAAPAPPAAAPTLPAAALAPATYAGTIPCADCPGIRVTLTLRDDAVYLMRSAYLGADQGRDRSSVDIGRWELSPDRREIVLHGGMDPPRRLAIEQAGALTLLDTEGQRIRSQLNYTLDRAANVDPIADVVRLRGMYTYLADAARIVECNSGRSFPVAEAGDNVALQRAYLAARVASGVALLATLDGRLSPRPQADGPGSEDAILVERFERVWPGYGCDGGRPNASLEGTDWRLVEVGGTPATAADGERAPTLRLVPSQRRVQGFAGCNTFFGPYALEGASLNFGPIATTRRACPAGMDRESEFLQSLGATTRFRVVGNRLALMAGDRRLAGFEAVNPR